MLQAKEIIAPSADSYNQFSATTEHSREIRNLEADVLDIVIVGAGPGGISAATSAAKHGMRHLLLEKGEIGNTIFNYQLRKHVMAEPSRLPLRSNVEFDASSREAVLERWRSAVKEHKVNLAKAEVKAIEKQGEIFHIKTNGETYQSRSVVLAIGIQGSPRLLTVPGANLPHVHYSLSDPDKIQGQQVVVVGAGDAGIENALALCEKNSVVLVNRSPEFARAKEANIALVKEAVKRGAISAHHDSMPASISKDSLTLTTPNGEVVVSCSHLIARLGAVMPRKFLESCGVRFASDSPDSPPMVNERYESSVPGLYLIGSLLDYPLIKQAMNHGFEVVEHILGNAIEPADQPLVESTLNVLGKERIRENYKRIRDALPLFSSLSDPQYRSLLIESKVHLKKPGSVVFERNDYTDSLHCVISGKVAIEIEPTKNIELGAGAFFGELGLISGRRRNATVRTSETAELLEVPRKEILKLISAVPEVKTTLDKLFTARILSTSIFPGADPKILNEVVQNSSPKTFSKGDILFREGDKADVFYVVRRGSVKISRRDRDGRDVPQTYIAAGNYVGEMALLTETPRTRTATASAAVAVEAIVITHADFQKILATSPETKRRMGALAEKRFLQNILDSQSYNRGELLDFAFGEGVTDADNVLIIDSDRCIGCDNCEKACAATHGGFSRLDRKGGKSFASIQIPISCRHCENPLCMTDCPPDALTRLPDGEVIIRDSCIGCGNCVRNCPYGVIQLIHEESPITSFLSRIIPWIGSHDEGPAKAAKCDMCAQLSGGPACVRSCPTGAAMRISPTTLVELNARTGVNQR